MWRAEKNLPQKLEEMIQFDLVFFVSKGSSYRAGRLGRLDVLFVYASGNIGNLFGKNWRTL